MARAIAVAAAREVDDLPPVDDFVALPGIGARGIVEGHRSPWARPISSQDGHWRRSRNLARPVGGGRPLDGRPSFQSLTTR